MASSSNALSSRIPNTSISFATIFLPILLVTYRTSCATTSDALSPPERSP
jgi:hypothetical protein